MKLTEKILGIIILIGLTAKFFHLPGAAGILVLGFTLLANFYFVFSFALLNGVPLSKMASKGAYAHTNGGRIVGSILTGFNLAVTVVGITFKVMHWPGAMSMLITGIPALVITAIICLAKVKGPGRPFYLGVLLRLAIIGIPALVMAVLSFAGYGVGPRG